MKTIAIEEAFATEELFDEWRNILANDSSDPAFSSIYNPLLNNPDFGAMRENLLDISDRRISDMNEHNIDIQILSVTAPGVQVSSPDKSRELTLSTNDFLVDKIQEHPDRFWGLLTVAPQDPEFSAKEISRMKGKKNIVGIIINSHTKGEYLDSEKFYPILEAAEAHNLPIYLHPTTPSPQMAGPFLAYGLEGPIWGFAAETGVHALRLLLSGIFDRFPKLKIILGHMGEGLPFWSHRINSRVMLSQLFDHTDKVKSLQKTPAEYLDKNFYYATSGMNTDPILRFCVETCNPEHILFAIDYPYESTEAAITGFNSAKLPAATKSKILYSNAVNLFNMQSYM